jgi:hypothetical protein
MAHKALPAALGEALKRIHAKERAFKKSHGNGAQNDSCSGHDKAGTELMGKGYLHDFSPVFIIYGIGDRLYHIFLILYTCCFHPVKYIFRVKASNRKAEVTIHGALHPAARHPANKATVSGIQPLAEGDFSWAGCVTVRGRLGREL